MTDTFRQFLDHQWTALGGDPDHTHRVSITGRGSLPSAFAVTELAAAAIGVAALAAAEFVDPDHPPAITVDRAMAAHWFTTSIQPIGWTIPSPWDDLAGDYETGDGWIRLHTNAPHHRAAALATLGGTADREVVTKRVRTWDSAALESAIVDAGGAAAAMRTTDEWRTHPQGHAVRAEPLVAWTPRPDARSGDLGARHSERPLTGVRVLDLTRVLAGPVATRFLAGLGAEVLRIDPPTWEEPGVVPDVTLGKHCARLDLTRRADADRFRELLESADVLVHGYRPGALDGLGFDAASLHGIRPGLVDVALDAYGWSGPWAGRRGFDSLVQMSAGIADTGRRMANGDRPTPLPVQALDHATGYLMAAAALRALTVGREDRSGASARVSLARTAWALTDVAPALRSTEPLDEPRYDPAVEVTAWGPARRLLPPCRVDGVRFGWDRPATDLGSDPPRWP